MLRHGGFRRSVPAGARQFSWQAYSNDLAKKFAARTLAFPVNGDNISLLRSPAKFFDTLMELTSKAKHSIFISSLYLGTGAREKKLVAALRQRSLANPQLRTSVYLDYFRAQRPENNTSSVELLQSLLELPQTSLQLLRMPSKDPIQHLLQGRWRELVGVHHMKLYIFDDTLLITGANLSETYFTNRQDRYMVIKDEGLCNFYRTLLQHLGKSELSYHVSAQAIVTKAGAAYSNERLEQLLHGMVAPRPLADSDTWVYPTIQMAALGIRHDETITSLTLSLPAHSSPSHAANTRTHADTQTNADRHDHTDEMQRNQDYVTQIFLASGYLNLTPHYQDLLIRSRTALHIFAASPEANGFHNAKGLASIVPKLYSAMASSILAAAAESDSMVRIFEWSRPNWTYHAKGLWVQRSPHDLPSLMSIGSPNFGARSVTRDSESQLFVVTSSTSLAQRILQERRDLEQRCLPLALESSSFKVSCLVRWLANCIRGYL